MGPTEGVYQKLPPDGGGIPRRESRRQHRPRQAGTKRSTRRDRPHLYRENHWGGSDIWAVSVGQATRMAPTPRRESKDTGRTHMSAPNPLKRIDRRP